MSTSLNTTQKNTLNETGGLLSPDLVQSLDFENFQNPVEMGSAIVDGLNSFRSVRAQLEVVVGSTEVSVGELLDLKSNQVIKLDQDIHCAVNICMDGKVIARGELVAVDGYFGVRISELPIWHK